MALDWSARPPREPPASDETFAIWLNQYDYDPTPLNVKIDAVDEYEDRTRQTINFAAAGKNQEALDILERAFEEHDTNMPYIGVSVHHITLRDEPRFQELLRRMNLPAS